MAADGYIPRHAPNMDHKTSRLQLSPFPIFLAITSHKDLGCPVLVGRDSSWTSAITGAAQPPSHTPQPPLPPTHASDGTPTSSSLQTPLWVFPSSSSTVCVP